MPTSLVRTIATDVTATEAAVLGLLLASAEQSGYDLAKNAQAGVGHIWAPARSQIYAVLPRLVERGLVSRRDVVQQARPDKQLYRARRRGERALREWLEAPEWRSHDELLLKLFFARFARRDALVAQVEEFRRRERERLAEYRQIERRIAADERRRDGYLTLRFGLAVAHARLRWADEALRELRGRT